MNIPFGTAFREKPLSIDTSPMAILGYMAMGSWPRVHGQGFMAYDEFVSNTDSL